MSYTKYLRETHASIPFSKSLAGEVNHNFLLSHYIIINKVEENYKKEIYLYLL